MKGKVRHKKDYKKFIWAIFIVLILVSSALGYMWKGNEEEASAYEYNGYEFVKSERGWTTFVNGQYVEFDHLPEELVDMEFDAFQINSNKVYLAYDPAEKDLNIDNSIRKMYGVVGLIGLKPVLACYEEEDCPDIPLVDCDNEFIVVKFIKDEESKVAKEDNCIIVQGDVIGMSKSIDRLSYSLLGVM